MIKYSSEFLSQFTVKTSLILMLCVMTIAPVWLIIPANAQNQGLGWEEPVDITMSSEGSFGFLLCDSYQNLHALWSDYGVDSPGGGSLFYRARLRERWSQPVDVIASDKIIIRPAAVIEPASDTLHVFWVDAFVDGNLYYAQAPLSTAGDSRSWTEPQSLEETVQSVSTAIDHKGNIHMIYDDRDSTGTQLSLYHTVSNDSGLSWSESELVYFGSTDLPATVNGKLAVDNKGRLHVGATVRTEEYGEYSAIHYFRSEDGGANWKQLLQLDPMGEVFPGVSTLTPFAFNDDNIHLTWHNPRRMHMWSNDGGITWSNPDEILPLGAAFGGANEIAQDSAGQLYAIVAVASGVFVSPWNGSSWGSAESIDDRNIDPHGQHLVACQGNQLHTVYYDRIGDNTVWYANKIVDAPSIDSLPIPQIATKNLDVSDANDTARSEIAPELESDSVDFTPPEISTETPSVDTGMDPLLVAIFVVCSFLAVVIVFQRRRTRS